VGGKVNRQWVTNVPAALTEIARVIIPKGLRRIGFSITLANVAAFNAFQFRGRIGGIEFTLANAAAGFTTPVVPLIRASGDLTTQAANTSGFLLVDVEGLDEIALFATCAAAGPTAVTVVASD
jgi:ubiquinone/menaquinone biosynthesis C-methylase UbiE